MGKVTHAYITYTDDTKKFFTVPITDIRCNKKLDTHIQPKNDSDFDKRKRYYVKWSDCGAECDEDHAHFGYYSAFIFYLGESVEHIQQKISDGGRLIIPSGIPSSESDEPAVKPLRSQKHNSLVQDVQRKKNNEVLDKHKAKAFLSARKQLINNSDDEGKHQENYSIEDDEEDNSEEIERIQAEKKLRVRKDLFGGRDVPTDRTQQKPIDKLSDEIRHDKGAGCTAATNTRHTAANKPMITSNKAVNIKLRIPQKSKTNNEKPSERSLEKRSPVQERLPLRGRKRKSGSVNLEVQGNPSGSSTTDEDSADDQEQPVQERLPLGVRNRRPGSVNLEVHGNPSDSNTTDEDSADDQEQPVRERFPLGVRNRRPGRIVGGVGKKVHREILEALQYNENQAADPNVRKRYELSGNMIHLGEGLETSAPVWFLIQQDKPQIFFSGMLDLLWPHHDLVNRCQNLKKVTTRLQDRSPMKELTPAKKRLSFALYSDYLDKKKIKVEEKMKYLSKVPYLITTKINYLRAQYYQKAD